MCRENGQGGIEEDGSEWDEFGPRESDDISRKNLIDIGRVYEEWNRSKILQENLVESSMTEGEPVESRDAAWTERQCEDNCEEDREIFEGESESSEMVYQVDFRGQLKMFEQDGCSENRDPGGLNEDAANGQAKVKGASPMNLCVSK